MKYSANSVWENKDEYDIAVIGAGHAGCEAALAAARMGFQKDILSKKLTLLAVRWARSLIRHLFSQRC